jgi:hypothetical protein
MMLGEALAERASKKKIRPLRLPTPLALRDAYAAQHKLVTGVADAGAGSSRARSTAPSSSV